MTAAPDAGRIPRGDTGSGWAASIAFAARGLALLGADPERAEPLLRERGLLDTDGPPRSADSSANGSCRLLRCLDGWVAVNLPRPDDLDLLPAWLGLPAASAGAPIVPWDAIASVIAERRAESLVAAGQELGLAVALVPESPAEHLDAQLLARGTLDATRPYVRTTLGAQGACRSLGGVRVVDLSALWAGPLCSRLLAEGKISPGDLDLLLMTDDPAEAAQAVIDAHAAQTAAQTQRADG